jgi:Fe-S cluster assembly protein SufD
MTSTAEKNTSARFDGAGFEQLLERRIDPVWITEARKEAWSAFESMEWPNPRDENWMRSDLRAFKLDRYQPIDESVAQSVPGATIRLLEGVDVGGSIRSENGMVTSESLDEKFAAKGVVFGSLSRCARDHAELVKKHLHSQIDARSDRFAALQAAMWTDGYFLYVPKNVVIDKPLHIHAAMADGSVDLTHTLIVLEDGAEATVLFESSSDNDASGGFHCGGLELVVNQRANLRFVALQDWGGSTWHFAHQRARVGQDANLQWTIAAMGSRFAQVDQQVALVGTGASSHVNGVMFTRDRQHLTYNTIQRHSAQHCKSDFLYKAVLQDRSRTVWRGMIKVDAGADKTDGYQRNDNLLLSDNARADSIPGLEILADDVRCTHGSTSGRVDEELIFYAQSRGFTRVEAVRMIVTGFFQQIFDRITIESVREALGAAIARQVRQYE